MQTQKRSLSELKTRAMSGLRKLDGKLQERIIEFAATKSPDASFKLTKATLTNCGFTEGEAEKIAKSARWAAIIRRDYKEEDFKKFIDELKSTGSD
jgi:hypothetical protein